MGYQIATEGFFDMFKKKKPSVQSDYSQNKPKTKEDYWNEDVKLHFGGNHDIAKSYSPINTITEVKGTVGPTDSYIAGSQYYKPAGFSFHEDMELLVQVNLADIPYNPYFPKTGIIQIYNDTCYFDKEVVVYINPSDYKKLELRNDNASDEYPWMGADITMSKLQFTKNENVESVSELLYDVAFGVGSDDIIDDGVYPVRGKSKYISLFTITSNGPYIDLHLAKNALNNKKTRILKEGSECIQHIRFMR